MEQPEKLRTFHRACVRHQHVTYRRAAFHLPLRHVAQSIIIIVYDGVSDLCLDTDQVVSGGSTFSKPRDKRPAGGERKAKKQATKPAAKPTQNKRPKPSQGGLAAAHYMKKERTSQEAAAFCRDSCAEEAKKKRKCHWALEKKEKIKVRCAHIFDEDIAETVREEAADQWKMWDSCTEQMEQRQIERQQKLRDPIKTRRKTKPQTNTKSFKKEDHNVPRF
ncbi:hypothetical protein HPB51_003904 [Rhipicephalus microplus]|uniref:Uncharacterized protein n=1 Tax=Rhipicephalus microplus TaxID=6941 RepID=A0A9J6EX10_RHIMP|nr:hypothetical protein HPB51_003904 [Rhipicephalus microplus]